MSKQTNYRTNKKQTRSVRTTLIIFSIIIVSLFLIMTGCKNGNDKELQTLNAVVDSLKYQNDNTNAQYNTLKIQYDKLATDKSFFDSLSAKYLAEIEKLKAEIARLKKSGGKGSKNGAKKEKEIEKEIAKKNKEIEELTSTVEKYRNQISTLQSEKDKIQDKARDVAKNNDPFKELASISHVTNIRFEPLKERHHGKKERIITKARKLNKLRIKFDINENLIPEDGKKTLYIVIKSPDGKVLSNKDDKTGSFKSADGAIVNYSMTKEVTIQHGAPVKDLEADWNQEGDHEKGDYSIAVYNDGHLVGFGSVHLK